MNIENILKRYQFETGEIKIISFGNLKIRLQREKNGWFIHSFEDNLEQETEEKGEYFHTGESNTLYLSPVLPEKPMVFKGSKLSVLPFEKLNFYLKIPLAVQIYQASKKPENLIKEIIHTRLSDTWFGEPDNGEIALNAGSDFFLSLTDIEPEEYEAICPIAVLNNADNILELQRLIIRVDNLSIYQKGTKNITSQVKLEYKGKDVLSSVSYGIAKNIHGDKPHLLAKPRNEQNSALKINFHFIKNIYKNM